MKKLSLLLALCLIVLAAFLWLFISKNKNKEEIIQIDVADTGFEFDVAICDRYFKLVECIINNDPNENWDQEMRLELKTWFKQQQEEWKLLGESELTKKCTEELENYVNLLKEENADSFGCLTEN